jgi:hypothetical protein
MLSNHPNCLGGNGPSASSDLIGDVDGPASATDNAVARFDGTTGKLIQNSTVTIADTTGAIAGAQSLTSPAASNLTLAGGTAGSDSVVVSNTLPASSAIIGAFKVGNGTAATNVAIGGGSMIAGANVQAVGNINLGAVGADFSAGRINIQAFSDTVPGLNFGGVNYGFGILEKTDGNLYFSRRSGSATNTTWLSVDRGTGAATFAGAVTVNNKIIGVQAGAATEAIEAARLTNTTTTGSVYLNFNETNSTATPAYLIRYGSTHASSANILELAATGTGAKFRVLPAMSISDSTAGSAGAGALVVTGGLSAGNNGNASYFGGAVTIGNTDPTSKLTLGAASGSIEPVINLLAAASGTDKGTSITAFNNSSLAFTGNSSNTATTGSVYGYNFARTFAPASGTPSNTLMLLSPTFNWGGAPAAGSYTALKIAAVETAVPTGTNYLINALAGASGTTSMFSVTSTGAATFAGAVSAKTASLLDDAANNVVVLNVRAQNNTTYSSSVLAIEGARTTTNATYNLINAQNAAVTGQFIVRDSGNVLNTNNSYGAISDRKLKENITDTAPKLAQLVQVRIRDYNLIGRADKQTGVIAQELEEVFPELVESFIDRDAAGNDLGTVTKTVKYSQLVPLLVKSLQELRADFEAYKAAHP